LTVASEAAGRWSAPLLAGVRHVATLFRTRKLLVTLFFATAFGRALAQMSTVLLIQRFLQGVLGGTHEGFVARLTATHGHGPVLVGMAGAFLAVQLVTSGLNYANTMIQLRIGEVVELRLLERVIRHILTLSVSYFDKQSHADIVHAVRQDVGEIRMTVRALCLLLVDASIAAALGVGVLVLAPRLALWTLFVVPLAVLPIVFAANRILRSSRQLRYAGFKLSDVLLQILRGIRIIKAYRAEAAQADRSVFLGRSYFRAVTDEVSAQSLGGVMNDAVIGLVLVVVILFGGREVIEGRLAWPSLLAFVMGVRNMYGPLNNVSTYYLDLQSHAASLERVSAILAEVPEVRDRPDAAPLPAAPRRIRLDHVSFTYGDHPVLRDVTADLVAGETIGVVGPSGSGKTTLLGILMRFYDPTGGRILFDDRDLRDLRLADVHAKLALVTQEPFLFTETVRENIRVGRPTASDAEVEAAARAAYIHEEIRALPQGYDTVLGVGGRDLSGGQRQRVSVARALLLDAPILVLDEATSSLDSIAEAEVQRALDRLMVGRTSIIVAHRLSTLRNADRLLVLDQGRLVGFAPHEELLRDCPVYRRLYETQQLGGEPAAAAAVPA
jgi:subfamily B ATP-binding cassette protein MsbA